MPVDLRALYPKLIHLKLDTVFVVDLGNQIAFVSDACEALLGYRAEEWRLFSRVLVIPLSRAFSCVGWVVLG